MDVQKDISDWGTEDVGQWLLNAEFDEATVLKFKGKYVFFFKFRFTIVICSGIKIGICLQAI